MEVTFKKQIKSKEDTRIDLQQRLKNDNENEALKN